MHFIGLDVGTTGCKATIFDTDGALLAGASREYPVLMPQPGWAEQDLEAVWALAQEAICEAVAKAGVRDVAALGLSVHGEAVTPVDAAGYPLRPTILGMDTRTDVQNVWLVETFGAEALFTLTGMPAHTINTLPKLLWIKEHEPDIWRAADRFLLVEDFLIRRMTGWAVISACLASRTQLFDTRAGAWSPEILDALELDPARLAEVRPSGHAVGAMDAALAASLGLYAPPVVVTGGHDQACGALGVGLTEPGRAMVSTGTAEVVEVALNAPALNTTLYEGNISVYAHTAPGLFLAMTLNHSGGLLLRWFRDEFCADEIRAARSSDADAYDLIFGQLSRAPTSLLMLPHFSGSGTPTFDTVSRGAILGLTFNTTRVELAKALLEGLTYELRLNLDLLQAGGVAIDELRAIGGGARSDVWLQLKADITGIPVVAPEVTDAAAWGAALLAGHGVGVFPDLAAAAARSVRLTWRFAPDVARAAAYAERYALYREVYPAVKAIHHRLARDTAR